MSLSDDGRWCDLCWDNRANIVYFRDDGTRLDVCAECDPIGERPDVYRTATAYRTIEGDPR